eukprot:11205463-Lingulodinium_polyedra.AAC.1
MSTPKKPRGKCDFLSSDELVAFRADIHDYITGMIRRGERLWMFGSYGEDGSDMHEKRAPCIPTLLKNLELWLLLLKHMKTGRMRDIYFVNAIQHTMETIGDVNQAPTPMPDSLFVTWLVKAVHMQFSHIRELKQYQKRFHYRIMQLNDDQMTQFNKLMAAISLSNLEDDESMNGAGDSVAGSEAVRAPVTPIAHSSTALVTKVLMKFVPELAERTPESKSGDTNTGSSGVEKRKWDCVPSMFREEAQKTQKFVGNALDTPPLPAGRGEIRKHCQANAAQAAGNATEHVGAKAYVEHAHKGNIRSTLRIRPPGETRPAFVRRLCLRHADGGS